LSISTPGVTSLNCKSSTEWGTCLAPADERSVVSADQTTAAALLASGNSTGYVKNFYTNKHTTSTTLGNTSGKSTEITFRRLWQRCTVQGGSK